ncbi:MAG TPA: hypothetical protein VIP11_21175 [Gemmatimonadaceae bacterium]
MQIFYIACAVFGGGILVAQLIFGAAGLDHDHGPEHTGLDPHGHASEGLHLRSARALAAGLTFFGLGGLLGIQLGFGAIVSLPIGVLLGAVAQVGTGYALRAMMRFEQDRTLVLDRAIGQSAVVYLTVPGERSGLGKVHVSVQERLIECPAVTRHAAIPTGSPVLVVDVDEEHPGTLVVIPNSQLLEESDGHR